MTQLNNENYLAVTDENILGSPINFQDQRFLNDKDGELSRQSSIQIKDTDFKELRYKLEFGTKRQN